MKNYRVVLKSTKEVIHCSLADAAEHAGVNEDVLKEGLEFYPLLESQKAIVTLRKSHERAV